MKLILATLACFSIAFCGKTQLPDTLQHAFLHDTLNEVVVTSSRIPETLLSSPVSITQLSFRDARKMGAPSLFDAIENTKGIQIITPGMAFKVINSRGFSNTTNVRFSQLVDGIDNQAPHLGAPIANALGASELDIDKVEVIPGTASALYGMNAINGLANIRTKNPFDYQGLSVQQLTGVNRIGNGTDAAAFSQTGIRFAKALGNKWAVKLNLMYTNGTDWVADDRTDLAATQNVSTGLTGTDNPAYDEVNGYGNESSNRRTLTLNGKKYVIARTGYREAAITDYGIENVKGDLGVYFRPKKDHQLAVTWKSAQINSIYQRSNRFLLDDYLLQQGAVEYTAPFLELRAYATLENTGKSYNIRSLAENMDRAYKTDNQWFTDYTSAYNSAISGGANVSDAHQSARAQADNGRFEPGTEAFNAKKAELIAINNWDYGAALRVKSTLLHSEGLVHWDKLFPKAFESAGIQLLSGFDYRTYIIIPDGNYFINPEDSTRNLTYGKSGAFVQVNKNLFQKKLRISATLRADKADYFNWKFNPRIAVVYTPKKQLYFRSAYQSGYRFPSIFEGFSNVNSGGVKRVGGLPVMSQGVFESSYTKASIDAFQTAVTADVNNNGLTQAQAIDANKDLLKKNPYTYLQPEYVQSIEGGVRTLLFKQSLFVDADAYFNRYENFIAQVEVSIPNTTNPDSIPTYLYTKSTQSRYRLWTNSKSVIYSYGMSLGLKYVLKSNYNFALNGTFTKLDRTEEKDGLEDGFNTPQWIVNGTVGAKRIWKQLGASITARYQSSYQYVSFLVSGEVPAYWSMDAQVNYQLRNPHITLKLGATNLLNRYYNNMLGGPSVGGFYYFSALWDWKM